MRRSLLPLAAALLFADAAMAQESEGGIARLPERTGCLSAVKSDGCKGLRPAGARAAGGWSVSANGDFAVGVLGGRAVVSLRRDPRTGAMRQLAGRRGCIAARAGRGCGVDRRVRGAGATVLSPDGRLVAVIGSREKKGVETSYVVLLRRDPETGALRSGRRGSRACLAASFSKRGRAAGCARAPRGVANLGLLTFGPEGRSLYSVSFGQLVSLAVDAASGTVVLASGGTPCFDDMARPKPPCAAAPGLNDDSGAQEVAITADGKALYVRTPGRQNLNVDAGTIGSIAAFTRDPTTGALSTIPAPFGCYEGRSEEEGGRADDHRRGYANQPGTCTAAPLDHDIDSFVAVGDSLIADGKTLFTKDDAGRLTPRQTLGVRGAGDIAAPPARSGATLTYASSLYDDDEAEYVPGSLAVIGIGEPTGDATALSQRDGPEGCVSGPAPGDDSNCAVTPAGLIRPLALAIAPDGANAYTIDDTGRLTVFTRDPGTGALRPLQGRAGCAGHRRRGCTRSVRLLDGEAVLVSPDGRRVTVFGRGAWTFRRR